MLDEKVIRDVEKRIESLASVNYDIDAEDADFCKVALLIELNRIAEALENLDRKGISILPSKSNRGISF